MTSTRTSRRATCLWGAVRTIAIADAVMSLDNVVAIAAAAKGHPALFIFGLLLDDPADRRGLDADHRPPAEVPDPGLGRRGAARLDRGRDDHRRRDHSRLAAGLRPGPRVPDPDEAGSHTVVGWLHYSAAVVGAVIVLATAFAFKRRKHATAEGTIRDAS